MRGERNLAQKKIVRLIHETVVKKKVKQKMAIESRRKNESDHSSQSIDRERD
jgi:hypothetical protein